MTSRTAKDNTLSPYFVLSICGGAFGLRLFVYKKTTQ